MWILLAITCLTPEAASCGVTTWTKETFITEKQCAEVALKQAPALAEQFFWIYPLCLKVPGVEEPV